jgi:Zn-dependent protease with chaperone function
VLAPLCLISFLAAASPLPETTPSSPELGTAAGYRLTPERAREAVAYSRARYRIHFVGFAWSLAVLFGLIGFRAAPRLRDFAERKARKPFDRFLLILVPLGIVQALLELPIGASRHRLARDYGLSVQSWSSWLLDGLKEGAIALAIGIPVLWLVYDAIRRSPRGWWLTVGLASIPVTAVLVFLAPLVLDPLFFRFQKLEQSRPALVSRIETLTRRAGLEIPRDRMFEMNASAKRRSVNAYVTGFGGSKRVVIWDTTLQKMTPEETLVVFGHEMGHFVLRHVWKGILLSCVLLTALLYLVNRAADWVVARRGGAWGIRSASDFASLPLLALLLAVFAELALPLSNAYSRRVEHNADIFALEAARGVVPDLPRVAASTFQKLGEINLSDPAPPPFIRLWLYTHPPIAERTAFAASYDPWSRGEKTRFIPSR